MRFNSIFVANHGIYQLHEDVLSFFQRAINLRTFRLASLFTQNLLNVINDSNDLERKFKAVFTNLNIAGINKTLVYQTITNNNQIQQLLTNNQFPLLSFPSPAYDALQLTIKALYSHLWKSTVTTQTCINNYGSITEHYTLFDQVNKSTTDRICTFCGLEKLTNPKEKRNEYDHYLNKDYYPYSAINFHNLIPMCDTCNKSPNKGVKNMILTENTGIRRLAYNPYSPVETFSLTLNSLDLFGAQCAWQASTTCQNNNQGFLTWKLIFNIDFRYSNYVDSSYERWLKNFNAYFHKQTPVDLPELRNRVTTYLTFKNECALEEGDFIEKRFWEYFHTIPDNDLSLFHEYLRETNDFLNN